MISLLSLFYNAHAIDISHEYYQLSNGLSVVLIEDHTLPQVVVDVWYRVGSAHDPKGASGFAHLFEHLMFMGTKQIPQGEFDVRMERYGGWNNASTHNDYTNYYSVGPSELLELLLYLEADRMMGLDITQEKLDLQRKVVRNERRQNYEDQPYGKVWLSLSEMMYPPGHPYHLDGIGSHEDLQAASMETVTQFYKDWYMPNNAALCISGDFNAEEIKPIIQQYFEGIPAQVKAQEPPTPTIDKPFLFEQTLTDHVQLPLLTLAWHSPAYLQKGDAELDLLAQILAGSHDSRLSQKWIQENTVVQEFEAFQLSNQHGSLFILQAYTRPDVDLRLLAQELKADVASIANGNQPLHKKELLLSQNDWEMHFYAQLESNLSTAETVQSLLFHTGQSHNVEQLLSRYKSITTQDIESTVQQYLSPDKAAVLYLLPQEQQ